MKKCLLVGDLVVVRWCPDWRGLVGRTFVIVGFDELRDFSVLRDFNDDSFFATVRRSYLVPVTFKKGVFRG